MNFRRHRVMVTTRSRPAQRSAAPRPGLARHAVVATCPGERPPATTSPTACSASVAWPGSSLRAKRATRSISLAGAGGSAPVPGRGDVDDAPALGDVHLAPDGRTASRPAAARTSSMSARQPSGRAARAASDGQMDPGAER
jgi:hypothetical protein